MNRNFNTTVLGNVFDYATKLIVWSKGHIISGFDSNVWRKDVKGNYIRFSDYGNTRSPNGWEIDHIFPVSKGGLDDINNLQPLQWKENRIKSDKLTY